MPNRNALAEREQWLARHALDVGLWELDLVNGVFLASGRWATMLGYEPGAIGTSPEEWLGRIADGDRERVELELMTHVEGLSRAFETEYRMRHRDGTLRWLRTKGLAERASDGTARLVAGHLEDITESKASEEDLRRSESRFRALIDNCPDAVAVHRDGKFVFANQRLLEMLGYESASQLVGRLLLESVHPEDYQAVIDDVRVLSKGHNGKAPTREVRLVGRDGKTVVAEVSSLQLSFDGQSSIFVVARDVTDRHRLQAQLAQTDRMASLGALAAGVAHEINNPLTYVSANLQTLMEDLPKLGREVHELRARLGELVGPGKAAALAEQAGPLLDPSTFRELQDQVQEAFHGSLRVQSIVTDLRRFTRADEAQPTAVALADVLRMAVRMAGHELKYRARITQALGAVPPVMADEGRLCQVFLNLLVNAAQAIERDHVDENEIALDLRHEGAEVIAEIRDTGCGIPPEHLMRIFDPFFTTKPAGVGSGLGLSICKHIIEGYGGRIEVESEVGRCTCFRVRLPSMDATPEKTKSPQEATEEAPPKRPPGETKPRILLIDDEPALCRALQRALSKEYEVAVANGGEEAVSVLARDQGFALVLCDLMMPDLPGPEVHRWVARYHPALANRIVFLTGGATTDYAKSFLEGVENVVIDKPVDIKKLRRLLNRLMMPLASSEGGPPAGGPVPIERRRGARYRAHDISGMIAAKDRVGKLLVVDYSESGLRIAGLWGSPSWGSDPSLSVSLHRTDPSARVHADVKIVRQQETDHGLDLCLNIESMDTASREVYQGWIREAQRVRN